MPDFNKGDKTQQGMSDNGWVWGQLEFNHKRDVFVAVTSDEEEEGLGGVYINVHDDLNNLDYVLSGENLPVGESVIGGVIPSGTIEITENAEGIDVSEYAYADVNVSGGSSLEPVTLLTITATSEDDGDGNYIIPLYDENYNPLYPGLYIPTSLMGLTFIYDNTEYNCEFINYEFGAPYVENDGYDFSVYPFNYKSGSYEFTCDDNEPTSHTIQIIMKPTIEKITITNSMAYDIPVCQCDAMGNNTPMYILVESNSTEQYDVLLYSGYGILNDYSYNGDVNVYSNLVNCHLDTFSQKLVITPNCSFTISQSPGE